MQEYLMTWWQAVPMILVISAGIYIPGCLIVMCTGKRNLLPIFALGPVAALALTGIDGVIFYMFGLSWGWLSYGLSALLTCLIILGSRSLIVRNGERRQAGRVLSFIKRRVTKQKENREKHPETKQAKSGSFTDLKTQVQPYNDSEQSNLKAPRSVHNQLSAMPAILGILVAAASIGHRLMQAAPSPEQVTQNYDSVFHYNVVARIIMTGEASSLHALPPIRNVYPIAFHQYAALGPMAYKPATAVSAVASTWLIFAALIWPVSMLYLVRNMVGRHAWSDFLAPVLSAVCAGSPFLLLDWGTLYAMFAGQMILPVFLGLLWTWCRKTWWRGKESLAGLAWIFVSVLAITFCHFRVMMTGILLALPLLLVWMVTAAIYLHNRDRRIFRQAMALFTLGILAVLALGFAVFRKLYLRGPTRKIADHLNGGPALPTEDITSAILRFLFGQPIDAGNRPLPLCWPIATLLVLALIILCIRHRQEDLISVSSFLLLGLVFVACAGTHADWAKIISALWYKDQRRLFAAWPIVAIPIICLALNALATFFKPYLERDGEGATRQGHNKALTILSTPLIMMIGLLICIVNPQMDAMETSLSLTYSFADNDADAPMLSTDEYLLMKRLDQHVGKHDKVLSDPWNGSGFMMAVGDRTPYFAHLSMDWDKDHIYIANHFDQMGPHTKACSIIRKNHIKWYVDMGKPYVENDPQHRIFEKLHPADHGMKLEDSQGRAKLYRITACE